jgi:alkanesulfonate monooxygenase SsuD/methylene tetrahydromethanopterin reductase-like flavin-dependent oxidoreductase (luciferase family)
MDVGVALPQMAEGFDRSRVVDWCRGVDAGPYSSVSVGERITYPNLEGITLLAAAATLTERVRVFLNIAVLPWHAPALIAKQLATVDVLSGGRLDLAVGIGGREQDYRALRSTFADRHQRLDDAVVELRRLWRGDDIGGGGAVGPAPLQRPGPPILASAMGPRALARAARWADGISAHALLSDAEESDRLFRAAENAWITAGRADRPRLVTGSFVALGDGAEDALRSYAFRYLEVMSPDWARKVADELTVFTADRLGEVLHEHAAIGCDEFVVIPATSDPAMLDDLEAVVAARA